MPPKPEFTTVEVPHIGAIDCGRVLPFIPVSELVTVAIPTDIPVNAVFTLRVRGVSLNDLGVFDGDLLICRRNFSTRQITDRTICAVYVHSTGELVAKRIIRQANTLTLRASGGGIPDREVTPDEIEIKGIVFAVQRPIEEFFYE